MSDPTIPGPREHQPAPDDVDDAVRPQYDALRRRADKLLNERDERVRIHIQAVMTAVKEHSPEQLAQPAGLFMSGMLTGLASSLEILGGTAEGALENVNARLTAAVGEAGLAGTLPTSKQNSTDQTDGSRVTVYGIDAAEWDRMWEVVRRIETAVTGWRAQGHTGHGSPCEHRSDGSCAQPPSRPTAALSDHQLTREAEIRGVQGWMAMDLHQALGLPVDEQADHQGHPWWADWWADLCGRVRQRTHASLAHTRALTEPEDLTTDPLVPTTGLPPEPGDLFFPIKYGAILAEAHPATPTEPPYVIDLVGVTDGDPLRDVTRRLIVHRSLATRLARDLTRLAGPQAQPLPADLASLVDTATSQMIEEHAAPPGSDVDPLEALGYHAMGLGLALERAEAERDGAYRERTHLVALLAALTDGAVVAPAPDVDEPGWQIAYLYLGGRQASWHIHPRDADLIQALEHVPTDDPRAQWDGHTTEAKFAGMQALTAELMQRCGPACSEAHTYTRRCEGAGEACAQHPGAPVIGGVCGGCTQYPDDITQGA
ncbi:hypothetical protein ABZZ79_03365 [Streptomyces sp. NPDC006458]|uniref:hypothetical protein n=1 Tax=Streptomyces sp. NPDC006458 TaxID=3154302 RepID=UPI0033BD3EA0